MRDAYVAVDMTGRILDTNQAYCVMLGYSGEELCKLTYTDLTPQKWHAFESRILEEQILVNGYSDVYCKEYRRKDGTIFPVELRTFLVRDEADRASSMWAIVRDISERKRAENIMSARLRLVEYSALHSLEELLQATLDEAESLTDSSIGFYHFVDSDQKSLSLQAWSTRTLREMCTAEGKGLHYDVDEAGVWVDCVRERKPVIHNDYSALAHRKGMPPGHADVIRELVVPVFRGDRIVAILGVGNKPVNYNASDIETVSMLADLAWDITERKRAEEERESLRNQLVQSSEDGGHRYLDRRDCP